MSVDDRISGYSRGIFEIARGEGVLERVQDELLTVARAYESSAELRDTLTDAEVPRDRKQGVIDDLLGKRASELTVAVVSFLLGVDRIGDLVAVVDGMIETAAAEKDKEVAEVRSAVELEEEVIARLSASLSAATGKDVEVKVVVDPSVIGGLVARVGDTVIDGTVRRRFAQLRQALRT